MDTGSCKANGSQVLSLSLCAADAQHCTIIFKALYAHTRQNIAITRKVGSARAHLQIGDVGSASRRMPKDNAPGNNDAIGVLKLILPLSAHICRV
eukprot:4407814-Amphidinium_carterae.1